MSTPARVLVVEDEASVRELVALHLSRAGFRTRAVATAAEGWRELSAIDAVVLDRMLPDESGDRLLRRVRADPSRRHLPILMLTARASEADRVAGLEAGADDYLVKPFSAAELVARVRALLRRVQPRNVLKYGELTLDLEAACVWRGEEQVELTRREFDLLAFLAAHPGRVFGRAELLDKVWGEDFLGTERTVDQHVAQLRGRLGDDVIVTLRGRGYRIADADGVR